MGRNQPGIFLLLIIWVYISINFSSGVGGCQFKFESLDWNLTLQSDVSIGENIHSVYIGEGKEGTEYLGNVSMLPQTEYFILKDRNIFVKNCLPAGLKKTLEIKMDSLPSCDPGYLTIDVTPTIPALKTSKFIGNRPGGLPSGTDFPLNTETDAGNAGDNNGGVSDEPEIPSPMPQQYEITVDDCSADATIALFYVEFFNDASCVYFDCSVNCTNDDKTFWVIDGRDVETNTVDMKFHFTYELNITCRENGISEMEGYEGSDTFNVTFVKACSRDKNNLSTIALVSSLTIIANKNMAATPHKTASAVSTSILSGFTVARSSRIKESTSSALYLKLTATLSPARLILSSSIKQSLITKLRSEMTSNLTRFKTSDFLSIKNSRNMKSTLPMISSTLSMNTTTTLVLSSSIKQNFVSRMKSEITYPPVSSLNSISHFIIVPHTSPFPSATIGAPNLTTFTAYSGSEGSGPPVNIVVVSIASGTAALAIVGAILYKLISRQCKFITLARISGKVGDREEKEDEYANIRKLHPPTLLTTHAKD